MDYQTRIAGLQALLESLAVDALLVEEPINMRYLTGLVLSAGALVVTRDRAMLFVDGRYSEIAQREAPLPVGDLDLQAMFSWIVDNHCASLAIAQESTSLGRYRRLLEQSTDCGLLLKEVTDPVVRLRAIKDRHEVDVLKRAGWLTVRGIEHILQSITSGVTEAQLAWELEIFLRSIGAEGMSFEAIVAFGANGSKPHHRAGSTAYQPGMSVLVDAGAKFRGYCGDCTRCMVSQDAPAELQKAYDAVQDALEAAIKACQVGLPVRELDRIARVTLEGHGLAQFFTHSLGHGVGLEVHEPPSIRQKGPESDQPLAPGMVITIEPGVYLPGIGGIRLEEMVLITANGAEIMTR